MVSRKNIVYKSFSGLGNAIAGLKTAILDGELVILGKDGRPQFIELMRRRRADVIYYAFDLIYCDGVDLRPLPLFNRKAALRQILKVSKVPAILYADHVERIGTSLFKAVCAQDLEGVVAKHRSGPYGAPQSWFKVLNPNYTQKRGRRENKPKVNGLDRSGW